MSDHISAFPSAWIARYANIPLWRSKSILPEHDGDMAWLRHLADRILDTAREVPFGGSRLAVPPSNDWHYRNVIGKTDINPHQLLRHWPADTAGELLRAWKAGR